MGRPSDYSKAVAETICERIATGETLRAICSGEDMPDKATLLRWLGKHQAFRDQYAHAREIAMEAMAEEILEISDDGSNDFMTITKGDVEYNVEDKEVTSRSKLRVDSRKWLMSKFAPKKYGDKLGLEHSGTVELAERIANARKRSAG